jgi:predicted kinase
MLHMMCGKIAAGKSTLAARLAAAPGTVLLVEDAWLGALFADRMTSGADYIRYAAKLRQVMGPHVAALLEAGVSVVLDFPANTRESRAWMRGLLEASGAAHRLHLLETPDALCLARLSARNARGDHPFTVSEAQYHRFSRYFDPPAPDEGFTVVTHRAPG